MQKKISQKKTIVTVSAKGIYTTCYVSSGFSTITIIITTTEMYI